MVVLIGGPDMVMNIVTYNDTIVKDDNVLLSIAIIKFFFLQLAGEVMLVLY